MSHSFHLPIRLLILCTSSCSENRLFSSIFIPLWAGEYWESSCSYHNKDIKMWIWSWLCCDLEWTSRQYSFIHIPRCLMSLIPFQATNKESWVCFSRHCASVLSDGTIMKPHHWTFYQNTHSLLHSVSLAATQLLSPALKVASFQSRVKLFL